MFSYRFFFRIPDRNHNWNSFWYSYKLLNDETTKRWNEVYIRFLASYHIIWQTITIIHWLGLRRELRFWNIVTKNITSIIILMPWEILMKKCGLLHFYSKISKALICESVKRPIISFLTIWELWRSENLIRKQSKSSKIVW